MSSIIASGLAGIQNGLSKANEAANKLISSFKGDPEASETSGNSDTAVDAITSLKESEFQVKASAKVVKVGDHMLGEVLDILA